MNEWSVRLRPRLHHQTVKYHSLLAYLAGAFNLCWIVPLYHLGSLTTRHLRATKQIIFPSQYMHHRHAYAFFVVRWIFVNLDNCHCTYFDISFKIKRFSPFSVTHLRNWWCQSILLLHRSSMSMLVSNFTLEFISLQDCCDGKLGRNLWCHKLFLYCIIQPLV